MTATRTARLPGQRQDPTVRRTPTTRGLLGALNREWDQALADRPARHQSGPTWGQQQLALAGLPTLAAVLAEISRANPTRADELLHALIQLHQAGDQLAGRTVLQTMLGKARRLAHTARKRGLADPLETTIESLWVAIATYPVHRRHSVAGNLALTALAALEHPTGREHPTEAETLDTQITWATQTGRAVPGLGRTAPDDPRAQLIATLSWARRHRVISDPDLQLLAHVHLSQDGRRTHLSQIAHHEGVSAATMRQRHSRAVRRLAQAVAARMDAPTT